MNPPSTDALTAKEQLAQQTVYTGAYMWQAHAEQDRRALLQALGCARNFTSLGPSVLWPLACKKDVTGGLGVDVCSLHLA